METFGSTASIAQEIQLSVAPVFLLTAIAGLLSVLSGRLSRAIDRARQINSATEQKAADALSSLGQSNNLKLRIWFSQWAIRMCVAAALLVCVVVAALFLGDYVKVNLSATIAFLFISAMVLMIIGLLLFLLEVSSATRQTNREL